MVELLKEKFFMYLMEGWLEFQWLTVNCFGYGSRDILAGRTMLSGNN
ncbi:hypothetical protein CPter91_4508 [Collimonas pratensis]|uniref:Uncharacterized protein n=1 Tax=Collimonas pratensis TaxID=279113 RepID=A0A127QAD3_9BURK|nr:hypothetical protein CPter91_4508 [Collimonas pratensis]